jgi:hypothetical protein
LAVFSCYYLDEV